jgi:hypothetical protein
MDPSLNQPLVDGDAKKAVINDLQFEKCELRVQGMTCGACVEVCKALVNLVVRLTEICRLSKAC